MCKTGKLKWSFVNVKRQTLCYIPSLLKRNLNADRWLDQRPFWKTPQVFRKYYLWLWKVPSNRGNYKQTVELESEEQPAAWDDPTSD